MSRPIRVLLAEDNLGDAELVRDTFEDSKFHLELTVVADGVQALDYLHKRGDFEYVTTPDILILDLNLPRIDGKQVLIHVRAEPTLATLPIVILTSSDAERDIRQSYALGANCYVTKAMDLHAFQAVLRSIDHFWFNAAKLPGI